MATIVLKRTGHRMPLVGLGLWKIPNNECAGIVYSAIKAGVRLLDGAGDYGNEKEAGEGVQRALREGLVRRDELFITSKLWNTFHSHDNAKAAAKLQLKHWGIDYFDLYLIHFPISLKYVDPEERYPPGWFGEDEKVHLHQVSYQETWRAMEELVDEGLVKNIGMSNVAGALLLDVLQYARVQPQVVQVELHPYLTQNALVRLTRVLGIALTAYSSFGPQGYYELGFEGVTSLLEQSAVVKAAEAHHRTPSQVVLRWATQRGIAVIPKSNDVKRIRDNLGCNSFDLTEDELEDIGRLNADLRMNNPTDLDPRLGIFA
ncbi:Aldo/keto reductase [Auriscalpium vulgare]|uniref:Aldo/keto reductase n=1 Tax=Auriscalpium vulgare TaxID=40419 RepID=A0ACB8RMU3_9AGAM|nr:Aldo/keto reductase [Auriscalpium vulgare]